MLAIRIIFIVRVTQVVLGWNVDPEALPQFVLFRMECIVNVVSPWGNQLNSFELWSNFPQLIVNSKLHLGGNVQKEEVAECRGEGQPRVHLKIG